MAEMRPRLHRRRVIAALCAATAWTMGSAPALAEGGRVYRIGILETIPADRNRPNLFALLTGLHEHGYIEGQDLQIEYRSANGQADRFPALAAELVRLRPDLIVTRGTPATIVDLAANHRLPTVYISRPIR